MSKLMHNLTHESLRDLMFSDQADFRNRVSNSECGRYTTCMIIAQEFLEFETDRVVLQYRGIRTLKDGSNEEYTKTYYILKMLYEVGELPAELTGQGLHRDNIGEVTVTLGCLTKLEKGDSADYECFSEDYITVDTESKITIDIHDLNRQVDRAMEVIDNDFANDEILEILV